MMNFWNTFKPYRFKIGLTICLVLLEGILIILFPLFIGKAIDSVIKHELTGVFYLAGLSLLILFTGAFRRFFDTRTYAIIYQNLATEISKNQTPNNTSETIAHINLLKELVDFFENSIPDIIANFIGLIGTLIILLTLNLYVFGACMISMILIYGIYHLSSGKTLFFNMQYNSEYEKQSDTIGQKSLEIKKVHFKNLMRWEIKLSDLETINFSAVWLILTALLCFSIFIIVEKEGMVFGIIFSAVMYVYQYMENTMNLPLYYQQILRLKDITKRINNALN